MHDIKFIKNNPELFDAGLKKGTSNLLVEKLYHFIIIILKYYPKRKSFKKKGII